MDKEKAKILIVDDKEENLRLLRAILEGNGYETISAQNGQEALEQLRKQPVDLIVSDILMPKMDGFQLCRECKKDESLCKIPFIFYTATYTDRKDEEFALSLGADIFLVKPTESAEFLKIIEDVLKESRRGAISKAKETIEEETVYLREYSERLIRKLEDKNEQLQQELTERKKAEKALWESQERYRALVENTLIGIVVLDTNYKIIMVNSMVAGLFKKPASDFVGKYCFREFEKREIVCSHCPGVRAIASGKTEEVETQGVRDDGSHFYVRNRAVPFFGPDGVMKGFIEMIEDITERKKAEEALKATNQQLRASEQQLKAANQQLGASEQQLRAANQQLRASEQQLQAANQQLKANNLQLQIEIAERKKAEEALMESEQRFRAIFEEVTDGLLLADIETKKFYFGNKTIYQTLGYNEEEIRGLGVMDIHPQESLPYVIDQFEKQLRREITIASDIPVRRKDGSVFYAEINSASITLAGKTYLMGIFRDITERKKAEEALYKVNRALKVISECNQILVRTTDELNLLNEICRSLVGVGGYCLAWIGFAEQDEKKTIRLVTQTGYEEGYLETLNLTWSDTERGQGPTGTAIRSGKVCICRNILTDPKFAPWRGEAIKRGYGSSISIPLIAENLTFGALNIYAAEPDAFDEQEVNLLWELTNDLAYGIVTLRARAKHKQAEESLKKLSSAVEQTADIVIITDKDGAIEYVNPTFEKVTGYTKEETIGRTPKILKSGKHDQNFYEALWKTILSGKVFRDTLINKKKNNELYYAEKTITPIRDKYGNITHFVSVDKDITEHKEIEKTQRLAQLGELVADMAHEVNNPLMIISGNAQLSLMEKIESEEVKNNLKIIIEECQKAKSIIQRLLKFSRPSKGELKETDINKNIESVVSIVEHQFKLANIEIKRNYAESLPFIFVDGEQMQEIFMNLLNNSRDAMPEGGEIIINTSLDGEYCKIEMKDSGAGMDDKTLARVFEPFFTTKEKGTGLGLSVCFGIIKAHNGKIEFKNQPQKGTTAHIWLPIKAEGV